MTQGGSCLNLTVKVLPFSAWILSSIREFDPIFHIGLNKGMDVSVDWEGMEFVCLETSLASHGKPMWSLNTLP